jgi:antitoxin VapB
MVLSIRNTEADLLARQLADFEEKPITDAVIIALKEALQTRRKAETPRQTAERIARKHGIVLPQGCNPRTPRDAFQQLDHDELEFEAVPSR